MTSRLFKPTFATLSKKYGQDKAFEVLLEGTRFESRPYYTGKPWFLAPSIHYYRIRDRLKI